MSNRDSLGFGDLIPQDVVDIFAQEKHSRRSQKKKKKRTHSLGRALGWLKGKNRKDLGAKGQNLGLGPALDLALDGHPAGHQGGHKGGQRSGRQTHSQAATKRDDDDKTPIPPLFQENVFIEASRPQYLENLHTEALEGLKMMQQEETNNGVEFRDNESMISSMTVQTDGEGGGFMTDSTIADTTSVVSVQSSVSTRSSRSGLTRQASTFRPLNSGKKAKTRKRHRKTVAGIPQHVQMELGLDRGGWAVAQKYDEEQFYNGETDDSPTTEAPRQAAESENRASNDIDPTQPLNKKQLGQLNATHAGHRDDMALLHCLGPDLSAEKRPRSLAVPWMTTANSLQPEPPSPVITTSPQAAYMSKIIPNAVLPPSIDVVEISRGRSRNSVRTVSKTNLLLSSPASSRASSRASSSRTTSSRASSTKTTSSRASTINSRYPLNASDSSCWSNSSESSDTLVSDSSTISSNSTPRQNRSQDGDGPSREDKITSMSRVTKSTSNGKFIIKGDEVKKDGQFVRSLSVMKSKRAPPPPNRSYSLHNKMKRRSRDLADITVIPGESSHHSISASREENEKNKSGSPPMHPRIIDSPGYNADTSSLDESSSSISFSPIRSQLQTVKVVETVSKDASQEKQLLQQQSKESKIVSPSSGYSSQEGTSAQLPKQPVGSSPRHKRGLLAKLQRFFPGSTPPASPPPPHLTRPEAHKNTKSTEVFKPHISVDPASVSPSVRTLIDLFNIPPPPKVHAPPPPPPEVWAHSKRTFELLLGPPAPDNVYAIIKKNPKDRRQQRKPPSASTDGSVAAERKHKSPTVATECVNRSPHALETKAVQESRVLNAEIHKEASERLAEQNVDLKGNRIVTEKDEKVRVSDILNGMLVKTVERREERLATVKEEEVVKTVVMQASGVKTTVDTLPAILLARIPPYPSPPPVHNPPQPPTKQTTEVASVASAQVVVSPEMSWPPPPPPMGLGGSDEIDFPLPPPPMFGEEGFVMPVQLPPQVAITGGAAHCITTPVVSVVKTDCARATAEAEPQKPSSQATVPPLNIPPPPSYTAPPPPLIVASPAKFKKFSPPTPKVVSPPPPPPIEVSVPTPKVVSPPPPPPIEVSVPTPKVVSPPPPPPIEVSVPTPKVVSPPPPPPIEVSVPTPKVVSPPPTPKVVSPPPTPKVVSPPPPPPIEVSVPTPKVVSPPPTPKVVSPRPTPKVVSPPPPPIEISPPPPPITVSPPTPKHISPPPPPIEVPPPPPTKVSPPPPIEVSTPPVVEVYPPPVPVEVSSPPTPVEVSPPPPVDVSPPPPHKEEAPPPKEVFSPPPAEEVSPPPPTLVPPSPPPKERTPVDIKVSVEEASILSTKVVSSPSSQENAHQPPEEGTLAPPQSIPPPPPLMSQPQSSEQEIDVPQKNIPVDSEPVSSNSILTPPQSIPPPPPIQLLHQAQSSTVNADGPAETSNPPPADVTDVQTALESPLSTEKPEEPVPSLPVHIPLTPPLPVQDLTSIKHQPTSVSTENQTPELTSAPVVQEEPIVTPSLLEMVKLRSVNSSPEPPKAQEQPEAEVTMRNRQPSNQTPATSAGGEAPQKPIRKSLIVTSPTATSPPATVTSQLALPKSQSFMFPPVSSPISPRKKSPPTMTASPSMNLQEAIRLRTAARSSAAPSSRLSSHSPTSPDPRRSPSSTASFIFSKSNKRLVIDTKSATQKNMEVSSATKAMSEAEVKMGVKVPPPVAKKPKSKGKGIETSEGTEQTAGQEALQQSIIDAAEKTNGTAGTVEGGGTPSA